MTSVYSFSNKNHRYRELPISIIREIFLKFEMVDGWCNQLCRYQTFYPIPA